MPRASRESLCFGTWLCWVGLICWICLIVTWVEDPHSWNLTLPSAHWEICVSRKSGTCLYVFLCLHVYMFTAFITLIKYGDAGSSVFVDVSERMDGDDGEDGDDGDDGEGIKK